MNEPAVYLIVGALVILAAWMPLFINRTPLSLPMIGVGLGALLTLAVTTTDPFGQHSAFMEYLSEFALLVSVLGAGLKIDRRFSPARWMSTWRLLGIVMLLSIGGVALAGHELLGLSAGMAVLSGAILAPTDPVLASNFGVGPPGLGEEGETKFALTSEAGLNDGLAFPFVTLGLVLVGAETGIEANFWYWALIDLLWNIAGGAALGIVLGWLLVRVNDRLPLRLRLSSSKSGLVSVGLAFLAYGIALAINCNGFVAVFCEAAAVRNFTPAYEYSRTLNHNAEQFERVAMVGVLALLGISAASGLFDTIGLREIAYALVVLFVVRPVTVMLGFIGSREDRWTRMALGYLGIRGIASLFYVTYVGTRLAPAAAQEVTAVVGLVILMSVVVYGTTTDLVARLLVPDEPTGESGEEKK